MTRLKTAHAHCILDNYGYRHTLRICNTDFSLQQYLQEGPSTLRYTYIACSVFSVSWSASDDKDCLIGNMSSDEEDMLVTGE